MSHELTRLQYITLGSITALAAICVLLPGVVWVILNLRELRQLMLHQQQREEVAEESLLDNCLPDIRQQAPDELPPEAIQYFPGQIVIVTEGFSVDAGLGAAVNEGEPLQLIQRRLTSAGPRWQAEGFTRPLYVPYIAEDMIRSATDLELRNMLAADTSSQGA